MTYTIGNLENVAELLKQAHQRADLFTAIVESMGESVLVVDREGKEIYSNQELKRFRGDVRPEDDLDAWRSPRRMRIFDAQRRELAPEQWPVARALRGDYSTNFEIIVEGMAHRQGDTILSISTRSMINNAGEVAGAVIVTRDITDLRMTERELQQSQKLEAIGQLTGGIAHDFNNLLTVILGNADVLATRLADRPDLQVLANTLAIAAERGAELTHHMLAFSRRQPIQPRSIDVRELVQRMRALLSRVLGGEIEFNATCADDLWYAQADPTLLETAILNLCINARDAMESGGRLSINLENSDLSGDEAAHRGVRPGEYVKIEVADTGEGIAPEILSRVFEPFFTTKAVGQGTGLGLSMVYGFVKQSDGGIDLRSDRGAGTRVAMYLPRAHTPVDEAPCYSEALEELGGTEAILVVEDDDLVRQHAHDSLVSLGYSVSSAGTGLEALSMLSDGKKAFDLLFTDIRLPGGMSGATLARLAQSANPHLRVLLTTGYASQSETSQIEQLPPYAFLRKPYSLLELARAVRSALRATRVANVG